MDILGFNASTAGEILLAIVCILLGAYARAQEKRIEKLEDFRDTVLTDYVTKMDFNMLAQELKDSLRRIEDKLDRRGREGDR